GYPPTAIMVLLGSRATVETSSPHPLFAPPPAPGASPRVHRRCPPATAGRRGDRVADTPATRTTAPTASPHGGPRLRGRPSAPPTAPPTPRTTQPTPGLLLADPFDAYPRAD